MKRQQLELEKSKNTRKNYGRLTAGIFRIYNLVVWAERAVIHAPEGGYGLDEQGNVRESAAINLPPGYIKGKVGAGDAFCAGVIYTAFRGGTLADGLELGNAAAASLSMPGATEGMLPAAELARLRRRWQN